ncbi:hypothetical protein ACMXYY_08450 [Acinetobacter courvalinii]|nr:hypothetical protein [Acinetobacter courvalinii]
MASCKCVLPKFSQNSQLSNNILGWVGLQSDYFYLESNVKRFIDVELIA